jgi:hypothetical protein
MTAAEMIEHLRELSNEERLAVIESASRLVRMELPAQGASTKEAQRRRLRAAAAEARALYERGGELTEWSALDGEEFLDGYFQG